MFLPARFARACLVERARSRSFLSPDPHALRGDARAAQAVRVQHRVFEGPVGGTA